MVGGGMGLGVRVGWGVRTNAPPDVKWPALIGSVIVSGQEELQQRLSCVHVSQ